MAEVSVMNGEITGTTVDAYPTTSQYENKRIGYQNHKYLIIENTGGTNGLTYKVEVKDHSGTGLRTFQVNGSDENNIALSSHDEVSIDGNYSYISISAKAQVASSQTTFSLRMSSRKDFI